jgi:hypothetical protein
MNQKAKNYHAQQTMLVAMYINFGLEIPQHKIRTQRRLKEP